jgi:hypothetical protein
MSDTAQSPQTALPKTLNHNAFVLGVFFLFVGFATLFIDAQQLRQNALFILLQGLSFAAGGTFICAWLRYIRRPRSRT